MTMNKNFRSGYSWSLVEHVRASDQSLPHIQFASYAILNKIPAAAIAAEFGVSRATVYNWFKGVHSPRPGHIQQMLERMGRV